MILFYKILIILALLCISFMILLARMAGKARKRANEEYEYSEYLVACAGGSDPAVPETLKSVSEVNTTFVDIKGQTINIDDFQRFIVHGNSMSLCGIVDGSIIMVKEDASSAADRDSMPKIMVIKRRNSIDGEAGYKVRRVWYISTIDALSDEDIFSEILKVPGFSNLISSPQSPGLQAMIDDFKNVRITRYLEDYPGADAELSPYHKVVLSTTLDTTTNRIHFSIHPLANVVGEVQHVFSLS